MSAVRRSSCRRLHASSARPRRRASRSRSRRAWARSSVVRLCRAEPAVRDVVFTIIPSGCGDEIPIDRSAIEGGAIRGGAVVPRGGPRTDQREGARGGRVRARESAPAEAGPVSLPAVPASGAESGGRRDQVITVDGCCDECRGSRPSRQGLEGQGPGGRAPSGRARSGRARSGRSAGQAQGRETSRRASRPCGRGGLPCAAR